MDKTVACKIANIRTEEIQPEVEQLTAELQNFILYSKPTYRNYKLQLPLKINPKNFKCPSKYAMI